MVQLKETSHNSTLVTQQVRGGVVKLSEMSSLLGVLTAPPLFGPEQEVCMHTYNRNPKAGQYLNNCRLFYIRSA